MKHSTTTHSELQQLLGAKLQEWNISPAQQFYDLQPSGILNSFPCDTEGLTEAHLSNGLWWWRQANSEQYANVFNHFGNPQYSAILLTLFKDYFEQSAYYYEMRARFGGRYTWDFGRPWIACSQEQRRMLQCLWPNPTPPVNYSHAEAKNPAFICLTNTCFNIAINDAVLVRQFLDEINQERARQGIVAPGYHGGVRRRPLSWLPIECMDIKHYQARILTDSERSQVSKAVREYRDACTAISIRP